MDNTNNINQQSLIEWYSIDKDAKTLLVNGADSGLSNLLKERSSLKTADDYAVLTESENKYDLIIMYDLYGFCIMSHIEVVDMIKCLLSHLTSDGSLLLAVDNKLGLQYWAGVQEEQKGGYFVGIQDYSEWSEAIRPLSKKEITDILQNMPNVEDIRFYYPYPDYRYPVAIYTDDCLPDIGDLNRGPRTLGRRRYILFDERRAYDSLVKAGLYSEFANSFLIEVRPKAQKKLPDEKFVYTKYSADRIDALCLRTDRFIDKAGNPVFKKVALTDEATEHLDSMVSNYSKLQKRYEGRIRLAKVSLDENSDNKALTVETIFGVSLSGDFEELVSKADKEGLTEAFDNYRDYIYYSANSDSTVTDFKITPQFTKVFGEANELNHYDEFDTYGFMSAEVTDIDMVFDNIIVSPEGIWQLIDYEWTFDFPIPREFVLYRTLWYFYNFTSLDKVFPWHEIMEHFGIEHNMELSLRHMEVNFQAYIAGGRKSIEQLVDESQVRRERIDDNLLDIADSYRDAQWYKEDYLRVKLQQQQSADNYRQDALFYKKTASSISENYNNLLDLYQTQTPSLLKRLAKKILRR